MNVNSPDGKKNLRNLPFWEVGPPATLARALRAGLMEFGFVAVVLILLFGILNYFNILSLSDTFPQQFSWLPHQKQTAQPASSYTTSPTPSTSFVYDSKKAQITLSQYTTQNLNPDVAPSDYTVEQTGPSFISRFAIKEVHASSTLYYQQNGNIVNLMTIFIDVSSIKETIATPTLANSLLTSYFSTFNSSIATCVTQGLRTYCESFGEEQDGKRGFGINFVSKGGTLYKSIFTCFVPKASEFFQKQQSCLTF